MTRRIISRTSLVVWLVTVVFVAAPAAFAAQVLIDDFEEDAFSNGPTNVASTNYFNPSPGSGSIANTRFVTLCVGGGCGATPADEHAAELILTGGDDGVKLDYLGPANGVTNSQFSILHYNGISVDLTGGGTEDAIEIEVTATTATEANPMSIRSDVQFSQARLTKQITGPGTISYPFSDFNNTAPFNGSVAALDFLVFSHFASAGETASITISDIRTSGTGVITPPPTRLEWVADTLGNWSAESSWTPVDGPPDTANQTAVFGDMTTGPTTAVLTSDVTVNRIEFDSSNSYAIGGLFDVSLGVDPDDPNDPNDPFGAAPSLTVSGGTAAADHQFQAVVNLLDDTTIDVEAGSTLSFNNVLNLNGHDLAKTGGGTLLINNSLNSGGGTIIGLGGVIGGSGTVGGDLINNGGVVSPGTDSGIPHTSGGGETSVPEPSTLMLLLTLGALAAVGWHRRRQAK